MKKYILFTCAMLITSVVWAESYSGALPEKLYVVGDACEAGWSTDNALEMQTESAGIYVWEGTLTAPDDPASEGGRRFKFLVDRSWSISLTCDINTTTVQHEVIVSGEPCMLYQKGENEGKDNAFMVPETAIYSIRVDLTGDDMVMTCTKAGEVVVLKPDLSQLYLVGDAVNGWNPAGVAMTYVEEGVFVWSGTLADKGEKNFKFLNESGTWNKTIVPDGGRDVVFTPGGTYDLLYRPGENDPGDARFVVPEAGEYYLLVDLNAMILSLDYTKPTSGDLFIGGTAVSDGVDVWAMREVENGIFTWSGQISAGSTSVFYFLTEQGRLNRSIHPAGSDVVVEVETEYPLYYRPFTASPYDFYFSVPESGVYTVDVNLNDLTVIVEEGSITGLPDAACSDAYSLQVGHGAIQLQVADGQSLRHVTLFDLGGRCLCRYADVKQVVQIKENLPVGLYVLKVLDGNGQLSVQKVLVK